MTPEEIRELRKGLRMTQEQFARLIGKSSGRAIREWESGKVKPDGSALVLMKVLRAHPYSMLTFMRLEVLR